MVPHPYPAPWLVAYTRPRHEQQVRQYCEERGMEVFLPCHWTWRRWSDRRKRLLMPLFASYVFLRVDERQRQSALQAPGMLWFIHNRFGPVRVNEDEIAAIRRLLDSGLAFDPFPLAQVGEEVQIVKGVMRGCRGRLVSKSGAQIVLAVTAVNGGVRVTLPDPSWVVSVQAERGSGNGLEDAVGTSGRISAGH